VRAWRVLLLLICMEQMQFFYDALFSDTHTHAHTHTHSLSHTHTHTHDSLHRTEFPPAVGSPHLSEVNSIPVSMGEKNETRLHLHHIKHTHTHTHRTHTTSDVWKCIIPKRAKKPHDHSAPAANCSCMCVCVVCVCVCVVCVST